MLDHEKEYCFYVDEDNQAQIEIKGSENDMRKVSEYLVKQGFKRKLIEEYREPNL